MSDIRKKDVGVLLRLPQEVHERVMAWSEETGRSARDILLDTITRAFVSSEENNEDALLAEIDTLREENERLKERLKELQPQKQTQPKEQAAVRRPTAAEQEKAIETAQNRLDALRRQKKEQNTLLERGRVDGVPYEEKDLEFLRKAPYTKKPTHAKNVVYQTQPLKKQNEQTNQTEKNTNNRKR